MTETITGMFKNKKRLNQALQLAQNGKKAGYERLEFLGDRVIGLVVAEMLYKTFPEEPEGNLAKRFVTLVCEQTLADVARKLGLPNLVKTDEDELRQNDSVLADVCEAIIAALYLDTDIETVRSFMTPIWDPLLRSEIQAPQDVKSALQEWSQKTYKILPTYTLIEQSGPAHHPCFTIRVSVDKQTATGTGHSKKSAEQNAAHTFLETYVHGH